MGQPTPRTPGRLIPLPGGRSLAIDLVGEPGALPVFLFHGLPGSRVQRHPDDRIALRLGVRLILPDRPGCGLSTPAPRRRIADWPRDVEAIADALGIGSFAVGAWSGGAPYACAAAAMLPHRVSRLALVSPMAPLDRPGALDSAPEFARRGFQLVRAAPILVGPAIASWRRSLLRDPDAVVRTLLPRLSRADRALLERPGHPSFLSDMLIDAVQQGHEGLATELKLLAAPWGFDPAAIKAPTRIWHGADDRIVPVSMASHLAAAIPGATLEIAPEGGHFLAFEAWEEMLLWLRGAPPEGSGAYTPPAREP